MPRLNIERQQQLEPQRLELAYRKLQAIGYKATIVNDNELQFTHQGETVRFFPYSGWHTGKTIKDGRGLTNLLKQLPVL